MRKYFSIAAILLLLISEQSMQAQPKVFAVTCGKQIKQEFGTGMEKHEISISLSAGDKLNFNVVPTGDYLNIRAEIRDPGNGLIFPADKNRYVEPMFTKGQRSLEITTGILSATGTYTITLYNNYKRYKHDEKAGEYTFISTCYKRDGTVVQH